MQRAVWGVVVLATCCACWVHTDTTYKAGARGRRDAGGETPRAVAGGKITMFYSHTGAPPRLRAQFVEQDIQAAMRRWMDVCAFAFTFGGETGASVSSRDPVDDGQSVIGWDVILDPGVLAYTQTTYSDDGRNTVLERDVILSFTSFLDPSAPIAAVLTHEFGHVLGLVHSLDGDSVMTATVDPARRPSLALSDAMAARALYSADASDVLPTVPTAAPAAAEGNKGLSTGAIVGISIGIVVGTGLAIFFVCRY
jgi:hypothetical protein